MPQLPPLLVLGSINQDLVAHTSRLPSPGETVGEGVLSSLSGGKGANQAVAAARLGSQVRLIGAVGDDEAGRRIRGELTALGVDTSLVTTVDAATGTALIVVDDAGENQIAVCPGANAHIEFPASGATATAVLTQLEVPMQVVMHAAKTTTGYFAVNASPARPLPAELVRRCDLVIVNESEYAQLPELSEAKLVAVTYGSQGSALFSAGREILRVPAQAADVVNTVGAGDSYCAALTLGLAAGSDPLLVLQVATAAAAEAVGHPASQPPLKSWAAYEHALRKRSR
ncbi:ribokinase [Psychromicrobium sp. YIM B11713]|uniref:ribokinase n=1 Tax=Psychromicrobium sp. YIM B11713 TaxID=3145233 RepID=UPI00374F3592